MVIRLIKIFVWMCCLALPFFVGAVDGSIDEPESKVVIETVKDPIERLFTEVGNIRDFVSKTDSRNEQIKSFKIKFTNFITDLASQDLYKIEYQKSFQEIDQLETEAVKWKDEEKIYTDKTTDHLSLIEQSLTSYQESLQTSKGEQRYELSQNIKDLTRLRTRLKNYEVDLIEHHQALEGFLENIENWKKFLRDKMTKEFNKNIFRWEMNQSLLHPFQNAQKLVQQVIASWITWGENIKKVSNEDAIAPIFLIILLAIFVFFVVHFLLKKWRELDEALGNVVTGFLGKIFHNVLDEKILVAIWIAFYSARSVSYRFFVDNPHLAFFVLLCLLFIGTWLKIHTKLCEYLKEVIGPISPSIKRLQVYVFLILLVFLSRVFQESFFIKNELIVLIDTIILGVVSFVLIKYIYKNLFIKEMSVTSASIVARWTIFILGIIIFLSTFLELIGFVHLSRVVQEVVLENGSFIILLWFLFGVFDSYIGYYLNVYSEREIHSEEWVDLIDFIKNILRKTFFIMLTVIIVKSWLKNVFVFSDFWNIPIVSFGEYHLTFKQPIELIILYYTLKTIYLAFKYVFYTFLLKSLKIEKRNSHNVLSIILYLFILLFISIGLGILGFTYQNILIFASALGVGIGFGLQNIVNNFLSGIILLFEQPIRVGDIIETNKIFATVVKIGMRSTIVDTIDNSSIIIPNAELISQPLINWTLQDNVIAQDCSVGVSYGTDTRLVAGLLLEILKNTREILDDPNPQVWFKEFGDSSLNFTVKFWINKPRDRHLIKSRVMHAINAKLKQHNITIPFPQRDLHIYPVVKTDIVESDSASDDKPEDLPKS